MGWFISQKIGRADEARLYRRLFKEDDQFHGGPAHGTPRQLAGGQGVVQTAAERVSPRHPIKSMAPVVFYSNAPMCQFYYAEALEKDGQFEEVASRAWKESARQWQEFGEQGDRSLGRPHRASERPGDVRGDGPPGGGGDRQAGPRLAEEDRPGEVRPADAQRAADLGDAPGEADRRAARSGQSYRPALEVTNDEIARRVTGPPRREALALADEARHADEMATYVRRERSKVNFEYWRLRADMEQGKEALAARKAIYEADRAFHQGDIVTARAAYDRGLHGWRRLLDRYPALKDDVNTGEDLAQDIRQYEKCLAGFDQSLPKPFFLQDVIDRYGKRR